MKNITMTGLQIQFPNGQYIDAMPKTFDIQHIPKKGIVIPMAMTPRNVNWPYSYNTACGDSSVPCTLEGFLGRFSPGYGQPIYNLQGVYEPMVVTTFHELRSPKYLGKVEPFMLERINRKINPGFVNANNTSGGEFPVKDFYGEVTIEYVEDLH